MSAALLLAGFAASSDSNDTAAPGPSEMSAHQLTLFPDATESWPFAPGKGCFFKGRDGKDLYFLERLFLLLSFPNLALPGFLGRHLREAIRWKSPAALEAMGLPHSLAAFEIGDVALLEAAVYPQYASGAPARPCDRPCEAPKFGLTPVSVCPPLRSPALSLRLFQQDRDQVGPHIARHPRLVAQAPLARLHIPAPRRARRRLAAAPTPGLVDAGRHRHAPRCMHPPPRDGRSRRASRARRCPPRRRRGRDQRTVARGGGHGQCGGARRRLPAGGGAPSPARRRRRVRRCGIRPDHASGGSFFLHRCG